MKRISREQSELIDAVIAETATGAISPGVFEKDIHVTDALRALTRLSHPHVRLAFCGGTSLSKAYRLVERMSEDVDLKVLLDDAHGMSKSALRAHLGRLKNKVAETLTELGFQQRRELSLALNDNHYFASPWSYATAYEHDTSLRPYLSLEFTVRTPRHGTIKRPIGYLVEQLAGRQQAQLELDCVTVEETLSEKVVSFLRRYAQHRAGTMRIAWDTALVRHVYDVFCIHTQDSSVLARAHSQFKALVDYDVTEFRTQHADFANNPKQTLFDALAIAEADEVLHDEYARYLLPLIFGNIRPSYHEAYQVFKQCAGSLLPTL